MYNYVTNRNELKKSSFSFFFMISDDLETIE